jgi:adenine nucleotide transporter 17
MSLVHATSGSIGGALAMALTYPLDQVRTLIQAGELPNIPEKYTRIYGTTLGAIIYMIRAHPTVLYDGCGSVLETVAISNFLYFYTCQYLKRLSPSTLYVSTISAVINTIATEPLWKATMALKLARLASRKTQQSEDKDTSQPCVSIWTTMYRMGRSDGLKSLWSSTSISLLLVSNPVIQFTVYEWLRSKRNHQLTSIEAFIFGALSKSIATILTYPLQIVQTRLRLAGGKSQHMTRQVVDIFHELYKENGVSGLYRGCSSKLYQTVLTAAFMFAFYERIASIMKTMMSTK